MIKTAATMNKERLMSKD
uniref:Uncharacterized protein n=1 Tax=Rhizophora mucronata TaxID=61149 RepID=A0A2P2QTQ9_RHIMU